MQQISSKFVKNQYFRHGRQFSSFRQFFVKNEIIWSLSITHVSYCTLEALYIQRETFPLQILTVTSYFRRSTKVTKCCHEYWKEAVEIYSSLWNPSHQSYGAPPATWINLWYLTQVNACLINPS